MQLVQKLYLGSGIRIICLSSSRQVGFVMNWHDISYFLTTHRPSISTCKFIALIPHLKSVYLHRDH